MISTLGLLLCFLSSSAEPLDYSPCYYKPYYESDNAGQIICDGAIASDVLDAFRRNSNNSNIDVLYLWNMNDMTTHMLTKIVDIVAKSASQNVWRIEMENFQKVTKVPKSLRRFTNLQHLRFKRIGGMKVLPSGSITVSADFLGHIYCSDNPNLKVIKRGAFQGNFNGTNIHLSNNDLSDFDEAVFKPLMADSTARIEIETNPIMCQSCSLAWVIRHNRQYLPRITGDCSDENGNRINFNDVDPSTLENC